MGQLFPLDFKLKVVTHELLLAILSIIMKELFAKYKSQVELKDAGMEIEFQCYSDSFVLLHISDFQRLTGEVTLPRSLG